MDKIQRFRCKPTSPDGGLISHYYEAQPQIGQTSQRFASAGDQRELRRVQKMVPLFNHCAITIKYHEPS
jgi:hypothetical protein